MTQRAKWDRKCATEFTPLSRAATQALSEIAGAHLESWRYSALHTLVADLAFEAAYARTQLQLGPQPSLMAAK